MFIPFDQMEDTSRLWVYQCDRFLTDEEVEWLSGSLTSFLDSWKAHNQPLTSSFIIENKVFVIIAVDEASYGASGCSIDASVHELQILQEKLKVDFFTRDTVIFKNGKSLERVKLQEIKPKVASGELEADSRVFNTLISSKEDLKANWLVAAGDTWLKRYFKTAHTFQ
ncbi:MAG: hypothetical protein RIF36_08360 [Imperialibacter sp.]|uniref:hypothetical protein n=1 Tax=Imperialibacter sp. TaxID=2038411 RepID=UPI0032EE4F0D